jgi:hypothetical protein
MRAGPAFNDELLLARLQAPPELRDGVQSLAYWRERRKRLSWYRFRARREAAWMTLRWERRVRAALVSQRQVPIALRASAGVLVVRTRLRWWSRRAAIVLAMASAGALIVAPIIAAMLFALHAV